jgi:hypothetical protein
MKTDLTKTYKTYYTAKKTPALVNIELVSFLSIEGKGDPNGPEFARKIQSLYVVAYAVKFLHKARGLDFVVPKLEAQWWFDQTKHQLKSMADAPQQIDRSQWYYRLLIRMPHTVTPTEVNEALQKVAARKQLVDLKDVKLIDINEGECVQVLHVGPFNTEPQTLALLQKFMNEKGLEHNGLHHEVYLSDLRKTAPEKLRTILREPVKTKNNF